MYHKMLWLILPKLKLIFRFYWEKGTEREWKREKERGRGDRGREIEKYKEILIYRKRVRDRDG